MSETDLATLLAFFKAMANESRLRIIGLLAERERSVQELAELLGLKDDCFQDLYHFTVGGPVEDRRLTTLPAYAHLGPRAV